MSSARTNRCYMHLYYFIFCYSAALGNGDIVLGVFF